MKRRNPKILEVCAIDLTVKKLLLPLIDALKGHGYEVEISCTRGKLSEELEKKGYAFKFVKIERKFNPVSNLKSVAKLYCIIKNGDYDIVHVHTPSAAVLGRIAAKLAHAPIIVYTAHGFYFHEKMPILQRTFFIFLERLLGNCCTDFIFTQSKEDYESAIALGIAERNKIMHIGNGIDLEKFNPFNIDINAELYKKKIGISEGSEVICFIGRIVKEKGILELIEAFVNLSKKFPRLYLIVVGDCKDERDTGTVSKIFAMLKNAQLEDRVKFLGYRDDIPQLLKISDIFVLPSYREGMPRSIIEAMAMGLPVVATDIRGCREEVVSGETGFLVPPGDAKALKGAIIKLMENPSLRKKMGENGMKRARLLFDEKKIVERQIRIFEELLKNYEGKIHNKGNI